MEIMNDLQKVLTECLIISGMTLPRIMYIVGILWEPKATLEMLEWILENQTLDQAELYKTALKISKKYPIPDEEEEYE